MLGLKLIYVKEPLAGFHLHFMERPLFWQEPRGGMQRRPARLFSMTKPRPIPPNKNTHITHGDITQCVGFLLFCRGALTQGAATACPVYTTCLPISLDPGKQFRLAPSQWETALLCNDVSHWLGANLESTLQLKDPSYPTWPLVQNEDPVLAARNVMLKKTDVHMLVFFFATEIRILLRWVSICSSNNAILKQYNRNLSFWRIYLSNSKAWNFFKQPQIPNRI